MRYHKYDIYIYEHAKSIALLCMCTHPTMQPKKYITPNILLSRQSLAK